MPLAEPLLLPDSSRRLLAEIRVASLERFERARRFERLRFELAPLVLPGAAIALLVLRPGLPALVGLSAAALGALRAWRRLAEHHAAIADRLAALGRDVHRAGPALTPARLCLLQLRVDLLLAVPAPGRCRLAARCVARALSALRRRAGRWRGAAG